MNVRCPECGAEGAVPGTSILAKCPECGQIFPPFKNEASPDDHALDEY